MTRYTSDYEILVPESAEPGACLETVKCLKISAAAEAPRGAKTKSWCWNTRLRRWELHGESEAPPADQTITLQGADDALTAQGVIEELHQIGCPFPIQAVIRCDDSFNYVKTFPSVSLETWTPDNGYGYGIPGVDTAAPPPSTVTVDGTWLGNSFLASILDKGPVVLGEVTEITTAIMNDLIFCDDPRCGGGLCSSNVPSNGCRRAYAIYQTSGIGGDSIIVEFLVNAEGVATYVSQETFSSANGLVDFTCIDGQLILTDGTCIFTKCGDLGYTKVDLPADVPDGSIVALASAKGSSKHIYALFGTSGVIHSSNGRKWVVALQDGFFPSAPQQSVLKAKGDVVVTGGLDSSLLISTTGGSNWSEYTIDADNATDDVLDIGIDLPNPTNFNYAYLYPMTLSATDMKIYFSGDSGANFEIRSTIAAVPTLPETARIESTAGGVYVYVAYDSVFMVNTNHACDCYWTDLSPDLACASALMAVCTYAPNTVLIVSDGICTIFGRNDVAETPNETALIIDLIDNDRAAPGESIDGSTVVIAAVTAGSQIAPDADLNLVNNLDGTVTITPAAAINDTVQQFTYTVQDTGTNTTTDILVTVIIGSPDPSLLVC